MKFNEKLNLLMCLQNTPNNKLAKTLSVDPSLISRWRTGTRNLAKHSSYVNRISEYFATHASDPQSLYEVLGLNEVVSTPDLVNHIWQWLSTDLTHEGALATTFINRLEQTHALKFPSAQKNNSVDPSVGRKINVEAYSGNSGKRQGLLKFLHAVNNAKTTGIILMYSDESMEWMYEDKDFYMSSGLLLTQVLQKGSRIKIIHTIDRNRDELMVAIDRWLPFYMSGTVEPYFYPGYQENLLKRTMFVAPGIAALTSSTLSNSSASEQLFYQDALMIQTLVKEFDDYLSICRPLIRIYKNSQAEEMRQLYEEFSNQLGDIYIISREPSHLTLSEDAFKQIFSPKLTSPDFFDLLKSFRTISEAIDGHTEDRFCEWFELPDLEKIDLHTFSQSVPRDLFTCKPLDYTFLDLYHHIQSIYVKLKKQKHFHVYTGPLSSPLNSFICLKRNVGVIVIKSGVDPIYFAFNHPIMLHAFEHFIEDMTSLAFNDVHLKSQTLKALECWLAQAESLI